MEQIERCTRTDYHQILAEHSCFWDNDLTYRLHHPIFLYEFGDTAFVIRRDEQVIAYLLGFLAQTGPVGYVHMVAVRQGFRRRGLARRLYAHFADHARGRGCARLKATADPENSSSIRFHRSIGMEADRQADYLAPGSDRIVFRMDLRSPEANRLVDGETD